MATVQLEKVQEFLTCIICADMNTDPCTLNCQHTFCRKCVTDYTKTRPEALQTKTIPCPSCRQVTKVPDPTSPVEEWAKQIKPSIIILGLIDTSQPGPATTDTGHFCNLCKHLGETTPASSLCQECEMTLCERCTKMHCVNVGSRNHKINNLSSEVKVSTERMCQEHENNCVEFHCKDCQKPACQKCCILYHRACRSLLKIESMKQEMKSFMKGRKDLMSKTMEKKSMNIKRGKTVLAETAVNKVNIESTIRSTTQKAIDRIREKEKQLMDKLDQVTDEQISQIHADIKTEEIEIQMYKQYCEFIDQGVNSNSLMDMYDVYLTCESGTLMVGDVRDTDHTKTQWIDNITIIQDTDKFDHVLNNLQLGHIDFTHRNGTSDVSSAELLNTSDMRTRTDKENPDLWDVLVLDTLQTVAVSDRNNRCLKSLYTKHSQSCLSILPLGKIPRAVTLLSENHVMVAVPDSKQIITVRMNPDLEKVSTMHTRKGYYSLAVLSPSSIAAGCCSFNKPGKIHILSMTGQVMKSVTHSGKLFSYPYFLCGHVKGSLLVSDCGMKSFICISSEGDVLWQYAPVGHGSLSNPTGIATTSGGDILLVDRDLRKVMQLTERGDFVRDILTSTNGLTDPKGIFCDGNNLFVCDGNLLKEFRIS